MPRRRRRAGGYSTGSGTSGPAGSGADSGGGAFGSQPDLGGVGSEAPAGSGFVINNINTAIAQAAGRDLRTGPVGPVIGGGGSMMQMPMGMPMPMPMM